MKRLSKKQILLIQKLYTNGYSENKIVKITHFSKSTVSKYLKSKDFDVIKDANKLESYERLHEVNMKPHKQPTLTPVTPSHANYTQNPVNNVSKANSASSPTPNSSPVKNQPTSNLPSISTPPKTPENNDNTKSPIWSLLKYDIKGLPDIFDVWLKNLFDYIRSKFHHNHEDKP